MQRILDEASDRGRTHLPFTRPGNRAILEGLGFQRRRLRRRQPGPDPFGLSSYVAGLARLRRQDGASAGSS